jgi:hypothetical protein
MATSDELFAAEIWKLQQKTDFSDRLLNNDREIDNKKPFAA